MPDDSIANLDALAAVDLGSNSFHMLVARVVDHQVHVVDKLKERVALAEGLDDDKYLAADARERALACLDRFGQRIGGIPGDLVRAVGTNTLRQARNGREFLQQAQAALGHPIEVIPGREEARLVYLGVTHTIGSIWQRRLVVDIGGGSTECVIGTGYDPLAADSLYMGCVSWQGRHFPDGRLTHERFRTAVIEAALEVQSIERKYRAMGWAEAIGSSGTIRAVEGILRENGWSGDGVTTEGMLQLRDALVEQGHVDALDLPGLESSRKPVIAGGLAVLMGVFEELGVERMKSSDGALREGLIHDLLGRMGRHDVRDRTIAQLLERYHVDEEHARRVADTALRLLDDVAFDWDLEGAGPRRLISWAAMLHEIGQSLTYSGYHKHSAYIVENSDMPGFSRDEQTALGALLRAHRRKMKHKYFRALPRARRQVAFRLALLLRLAARLERSRGEGEVPRVRARADGQRLMLELPAGWLDDHPLLRADLAHEAGAWERVGHELGIAD